MIKDIEAWLKAHDLTVDIAIAFFAPIISAFAILILGWIVARIVSRWIRKRKFGRLSLNTANTVRPVIASVVGYFIILSAIYAALTKLGMPNGSLLAAFGGAALAIGLALQGTLSNIASGIMLLFLHPLRVGEFVETPSTTGLVHEIGLFSTTIKNVEGVYIFVPNSEIWKSRIQNFGRHTERKLIIDIGVAYDTDLEAARDLLIKTMSADERVLDFPSTPECYVMSFGDSAINLSARCILPAADWLKNASDIRIKLKKALDGAGIEIPFPQRVIHQAKG